MIDSTRRSFLTLAASTCGITACGALGSQTSPAYRVSTPAILEPVFAFNGAMPTGVSVSSGRTFVCFPKWDDEVTFSIGEIVPYTGSKRDHATSELRPYPNQQMNNAFMSVQSVVADDRGILWVLDTGSPQFSPPIAGAAKLISIDLVTGKISKVYPIPRSVMLEHTYTNDVRFDHGVGLPAQHPGYAYITDSSAACIGGIIILDLYTGKAIRRLSNTRFTNPETGFVPYVNGSPMLKDDDHGNRMPNLSASDGIEISPNKENLYFTPLSSRHVYSAPTRLLRDKNITDEEIIPYIVDYGADAPADGLAVSPDGTLYAGDYEHSRIRKLTADGTWHVISDDPRIAWPDTLSVSQGYLYFTANQLPKMPRLNMGKDLRHKPYWLFRIKIS